MATPKNPTTLHAALLRAQRAIESVPKDGRNTHHRYDYVSAETMISRCREVLLTEGLVLTAGDVVLTPFAATEHGDAVLVSHGMVLTFGGESMPITRAWPAVPGKGRPLDKAVAGALTACLSYALRDLLLLPRGDEPGVGMDDTERDHQATPTRPAPPLRTHPDPRIGDGSAMVVPQVQAQSVAQLVGEDPECPACHSMVYDNRNDPDRKPRSPLWKCSNRECNGGRGGYSWASWDEWPAEFAAPPAPTGDTNDVATHQDHEAPVPF